MAVSEIFDIIESTGVLAASATAVYGVLSWRAQVRDKRRYELAEEVLALFYEAADAFRWIRSPVGFEGEGGTRRASDGESAEAKRILDQAYVAAERYRKKGAVFDRLHALRYRFMATFDPALAKPFDELRQVVNHVVQSGARLGHLWLQQAQPIRRRQADEQRLREQIEKHEAVIWSDWSDESAGDQIQQRVDAAVSEMETACEGILRGRWRGGSTTTVPRSA